MTRDAYEIVRREVVAAIETRRLEPDSDLVEIRDEAERAVEAFQRRARLGDELSLVEPNAMVERIVQSVAELGPLTELINRDDVEEIFIEGARVAFIDSAGELRGLNMPTTEVQNRQVVERLLADTERHLSAQYPIVQARVLEGTARLTAAIPPVTDRLSATIRRFVVRHVTLQDLVRRRSLSAPAAGLLWAAMQVRSRVMVSGEPGAGKTTMLGALLHAVPAHHCVRCCEEVRELSVPLTHGGYYEVRPPGLDSNSEISLRDLVKFVLAMRPDRIVVGEVRGAEAFELSRAMNAGCGFLCSIHANGAADALDALVNAALMAGENVTEHVVKKVVSDSLDIVVHLERSGARRADDEAADREVSEIVAVSPAMGESFTCEPIFVRKVPGAALEWTGVVPARLAQQCDRVLGAQRPLRDILDHRIEVAS